MPLLAGARDRVETIPAYEAAYRREAIAGDAQNAAVDQAAFIVMVKFVFFLFFFLFAFPMAGMYMYVSIFLGKGREECRPKGAASLVLGTNVDTESQFWLLERVGTRDRLVFFL